MEALLRKLGAPVSVIADGLTLWFALAASAEWVMTALVLPLSWRVPEFSDRALAAMLRPSPSWSAATTV